MKTNKLFFAAATLMALTACSSDDSPMSPTEERIPVRLAYTTLDATKTRAAQNLHEGMFVPGDSLVVYISKTGADSWTDYTFIIGEDGTLIPKNTVPYYPLGDQNIDIAAFYPTKKGGGKVPIRQRGLMPSLMAGQMSGNLYVQPDQTTDADYMASDLMYAFITNQAIQSEPVKLVFKHAMAKICVNVTAGDGVGSITSVSIPNVKYIGYACPATGECGVREGYYGAIAMSNNGAAVIPAQTINGAFLVIETDKGKVTYSLKSKTFAAGHVYTLNITVNTEALNALTSIPITGWTDDEAVTVNPQITASNAPAGVKAVDLGLSVLWANMNVGATGENDEGTLFAWGETSGKSYYGWENYAWCMGRNDNLIKYCNNSTLPGSQNFYWFDKTGIKAKPDGILTLLPGDDAAHVNWGGKWRMPTYRELQELFQGCSWSNSYVTGPNGNKIRITSTWSSQIFDVPYMAYLLNEENSEHKITCVDRCYGFPVRPVMPKE